MSDACCSQARRAERAAALCRWWKRQVKKTYVGASKQMHITPDNVTSLPRVSSGRPLQVAIAASMADKKADVRESYRFTQRRPCALAIGSSLTKKDAVVLSRPAAGAPPARAEVSAGVDGVVRRFRARHNANAQDPLRHGQQRANRLAVNPLSHAATERVRADEQEERRVARESALSVSLHNGRSFWVVIGQEVRSLL